MVRSTYLVAMMAVLSGAIPLQATAQGPKAARPPSVADLDGSTEPNPLPGLPRPPDQPASLLRPALAQEVYECPDLECPYFARDPLLDPVELPQPGWLFDLEASVVGSHVVDRLGQFSPLYSPPPPLPPAVVVPMARLNWTVSPRFELGYRLPSGFGEFDVAYRFLTAEGTGSTPAGSPASPDGTAALRSRLNLSLLDLDYASHETSLGPNWDMKWRIGLRTADVFFDSRADESQTPAPPSGIFERSIRDNFWGIGPHAALELKWRRSPCGLGWVGRLDGGLLFGTVDQKFTAVSTTPGPGFVSGISQREQVPVLGGFLGLDWRPPRRRNLDLLLGYSAEYWWNVGRISDPDFYNGRSAGEVGLHGLMFRLEYNY